MPLVRCISDYRSGAGEWLAGKEDVLSDEDAAFLLRDSPGSFEIVSATPENASPADYGAMSTETASGLTVPDRRARGGGRR